MGRKSRTKGNAYEREVARELTQALGLAVLTTRNVRGGTQLGDDLLLPGFSPELKRRAAIVIHGWMREAVMQSRGSLKPLVICRGDGEESLAVMRLPDWIELAREHIVDAAGEAATVSAEAEPADRSDGYTQQKSAADSTISAADASRGGSAQANPSHQADAAMARHGDRRGEG